MSTKQSDDDRTNMIAIETIRRYFRQDVQRAILVLGKDEVQKILDEAEVGG